MPLNCPICHKICKDNQKLIECKTCCRWVHHSNRGNCSGLTNWEFISRVNDCDKFWECDRCCSNSISILPFFQLDENFWPPTNVSGNRQTSTDVNIISANDRKFASLCEDVQNFVNSEIGDDDQLSSYVNQNIMT